MSTKTNELREQIDNAMADLLDKANILRQSESFKTWLDYVARFHRYSFANSMLIMLQHPGATRVAGYRKWQEMGRNVRKGEKGIGILAPMAIHAETENATTGETERVQTGIRFKPVHVFDVSQTDGKAPPPAPDWKGQGRHAELETALLDYAADLGIKTTEKDSDAGALGSTTPGQITYTTQGNVPRTLAHELAHRIAPSWKQDHGKENMEALADLAAAIVCQRFDVDVIDSSAAYIAGWSKDPKALMASMEQARRVASQIIVAVEAKLEPHQEAAA